MPHSRIIYSIFQNSLTLIAVLINTGFGEISRPKRLDHWRDFKLHPQPTGPIAPEQQGSLSVCFLLLIVFISSYSFCPRRIDPFTDISFFFYENLIVHFRLANGKSIRTFSALLLHIVQCCLSGARSRVGSILSSSAPGFLNARSTESKDIITPPFTEVYQSDGAAAFDAVRDFIEPQISAATKLSKKIMSFLLQKLALYRLPETVLFSDALLTRH